MFKSLLTYSFLFLFLFLLLFLLLLLLLFLFITSFIYYFFYYFFLLLFFAFSKKISSYYLSRWGSLGGPARRRFTFRRYRTRITDHSLQTDSSVRRDPPERCWGNPLIKYVTSTQIYEIHCRECGRLTSIKDSQLITFTWTQMDTAIVVGTIKTIRIVSASPSQSKVSIFNRSKCNFCHKL